MGAEFLPDMGHAMLLDTGWQAVVDRILRWLNERGLQWRSAAFCIRLE